MNLGLSDFDLRVRQTDRGFEYLLNFRLLSGRMYSVVGVEPSPLQCAESAMCYVASVVGEAA